MKNRNRNLFRLIAVGLFSIIFLTLLTVSFYGYVLEQIGVNHAENVRSYKYHFVMIVTNSDSKFWNDVYESVREAAAGQDAYVELKEKNLSSEYTMVDLMDMSIAAKVDGIFLECSEGEQLEERINIADAHGIPVVTILNGAPTSERKSYIGINPYQIGQAYGYELEKLIGELKEESGRDSYRIKVLLNDSALDSDQFQAYNQINNMMVNLESTSGLVETEAIRIPADGAFESEEIVRNLFQNELWTPDIIVCMDEMDTEAVYQALIDYNRVGETLVIGYYKSEAALGAVERGTMAMSLYIDTAQMGKCSAQAMMEYIQEGRTNSFYSVDLEFINKENVKEFRTN